MSADVVKEHRLDVPVLHGDRRVMCALVWRYHRDDSYSIELDSPIGLLTGSGGDRMWALQKIREQLEPHGWLIAVQGARVDAYASGLVRQQGGASAVYLVRDGEEVKLRERVPIFDEAPADRLGTVAEQAVHHRRWRLSQRPPVVAERQAEVPMLRGDRKVMCATVWRRHQNGSYSVDLDYPGKLQYAMGADRISVVWRLQELVAPEDWLIAVQGARVDAVAGDADRDPDDAFGMYLVTAGREITPDDRVLIFDEAPVDRLGTPEQQAEHCRRWRASLG